MTFDRDGGRLALGGRGGEIQIRDARTSELVAMLLGHPMEVTGLAFTPDGSRLASAATDGVVKLWDPVNGVEVLSLRGHATYDTALAFSSDGERLLAGGWDGFLRMWSIRDPHSESAEVRRERRRTWHAANADSCLSKTQLFAAVHHLNELLVLEKGRWQPWYDRGRALAGLGEWDRATADLEKAMEHADCSEMPYYDRAHLYLRARDFENYVQTCRRMQRQFGSNKALSTTNSLLWISVLHPSAQLLAEELMATGNAALARAKPGDRDELQNTVGAIHYRARRDEEAIRLLDQSVNTHGKGGTFDDWIFLALAHHRQGRQEKAREYFDRATEEVKKVRAGASFSDGRAANWRLLIEMETLYEEVKTVLQAAEK
jgi:tetratricopeptide (TPR) repeat protein